MLKGKTTIELTDVNTGEKKIYEDHNMVTNFANYLFKNIGGLWRKERFYGPNSNYYDQSYYPYHTNMLGGLLLFDNEIDPKGGETIFAPTNASMVGCGAYNFTSTNNVRGSYNPSESYYNSQEKTMKYVYDFATNQANGTIKSVCLTSIQGGFGGYENPNNVRNDSSNNGQSYLCRNNYYDINFLISGNVLFAMDIGKEELYYHNITGTNSIDIITRNANFYKKKILSSPYSLTTKSTETYAIDINSMVYTAGFYDEKHNTLHVIGHTNYIWNNGVTLKVSKIDLTAKTVTNYTMTNDTGNDIQLFYSQSSEPKSQYTYALVYDNNFYLRSSSKPYGLYRKDITGAMETHIICDWGDHSISINDVVACNGRIFMVSNASRYSNESNVDVYNPDTDVLTIAGMNGGNFFDGNYNYYRCTVIPCVDMNDIIKYSITKISSEAYTNFITLNNYLATINNLETPITKTNTNTMKVIYTIQET